MAEIRHYIPIIDDIEKIIDLYSSQYPTIVDDRLLLSPFQFDWLSNNDCIQDQEVNLTIEDTSNDLIAIIDKTAEKAQVKGLAWGQTMLNAR